MKYTVITGASSGIGYATALTFAAQGKHLIITARRAQQLEQLKAEINERFPQVDVVIRTADLSENEDVYQFYNSLSSFNIETWINNAGFGNFATVGEQALPKIETMLRLNIEALTILSSLYVRDYGAVEGAQLINISSAGGYTVVPDAVTYCSTKFYVSAFTEGLARELERTGAKLKAKVLAPAATETEFAQVSRDEANFTYEGRVPRYHTAAEMAQFLWQLYESDAVLGIVNGTTYEFSLNGGQFNIA